MKIPELCELMPFQYFPDDMTDEQYMNELMTWSVKREADFHGVGEEMVRLEASIPCPEVPTSRIGMCYAIGTLSTIFFKSISKRTESRLICAASTLLPLRQVEFEGVSLYAPADSDGWLIMEGVRCWRDLPERTGVYVHDKDLIFTEEY